MSIVVIHERLIWTETGAACFAFGWAANTKKNGKDCGAVSKAGWMVDGVLSVLTWFLQTNTAVFQ